MNNEQVNDLIAVLEKIRSDGNEQIEVITKHPQREVS